MNNDINIYEKVEHEILTKLFSKNALTTRFNRLDLEIEYENKIVIGEFKIRRDFTHTTFDWILEVSKYKAMINKYDKLQSKGKPIVIFYINYFPKDNTILIWNLTTTKPCNPVWRLMNETTASGFHNSGKKVSKKVFLLDHKDAKYKIQWI